MRPLKVMQTGEQKVTKTIFPVHHTRMTDYEYPTTFRTSQLDNYNNRGQKKMQTFSDYVINETF